MDPKNPFAQNYFDWLKSLQVGQKVAYVYSSWGGGGVDERRVTGVDSQSLILDDITSINKKTGRVTGSRKYDDPSIRPLTPEMQDKITRKTLVQEFERLNKAKLYETKDLARINAYLKKLANCNC